MYKKKYASTYTFITILIDIKFILLICKNIFMIIYNNIKGFIDDATKPSLLAAKIVSSMKEKVGYTVLKTTLCNSSNLFKEIDNKDK